jgi:hypothetical protein
VTVTYDGPNCFDQLFTFRTAYTEKMHFCVKGPELAEVSETRDQAVFAVAVVEIWTTMTCFGDDGGTPGDVYSSTVVKPGVSSSWAHHLTASAHDSTFGGPYAFHADGTYTYMGDETLGALGNSKHYYDPRTVTGQVSGSDIVDWYFSPVDGTLLRFTRTLELQYPWGPGTNYHEHVDMTLTARPGNDAGVH